MLLAGNSRNCDFAFGFADRSDANLNSIFRQQIGEALAPLDKDERRSIIYLFDTKAACLLGRVEPVKVQVKTLTGSPYS